MMKIVFITVRSKDSSGGLAARTPNMQQQTHVLSMHTDFLKLFLNKKKVLSSKFIVKDTLMRLEKISGLLY